MRALIRGHLVAALLGIGVLIGLGGAPATAAPIVATELVQPVQYYAPRPYYRGPPPGYYRRPYYARPFYRPGPRYYARPYYGRRYYR